MLDVLYDIFIEKAVELEELMKDFDCNQSEIKCIIRELGSYWDSPESKEYILRYRKVKNDKEEFRRLASDVSKRMSELSVFFKEIIGAGYNKKRSI